MTFSIICGLFWFGAGALAVCMSSAGLFVWFAYNKTQYHIHSPPRQQRRDPADG